MVFALNSNLSYISIAAHLFFVFVWYNFAIPSFLTFLCYFASTASFV